MGKPGKVKQVLKVPGRYTGMYGTRAEAVRAVITAEKAKMEQMYLDLEQTGHHHDELELFKLVLCICKG